MINTYVCIDPKIETLGPWYLNGTLDDSDREVFQKHLVVCPKCSQDFPIDEFIFTSIRKASER